MKFAKNRIAAITIAIFLMLSMSASMILLPSASAHTPAWKIPTYAYVWATPNPDGVGQTVSVYLWLTNYYPGAAFGNDLKFHNYELTITAPNGAVTTQTFPIVMDSTSNQHTSFIPDQTGTYNLTFTYPGETITSTTPIAYGLGASFVPNPFTNDTFEPSSASTTVTVTTTLVPNALTGAPLPTAYWTRPIYGENTNWWSISSNWLGLSAPNYGGYTNWGSDESGLAATTGGEAMFPGDAIGSLTSHVMWTNPLQSGGIVGGNNYAIQGQSYFDGSAYIIRYNNPIILDGMLYYSAPLGFSNTGYNSAPGAIVCVNLQTGQQIWSSTSMPALSMGYMPDEQTQNEHGVCPPLLISQTGGVSGLPGLFPSGPATWQVFDGDTGKLLCTVDNVPPFGSGRVMGPDGEYLNYVFANAGTPTNPDWTLGEWNSSLLFLPFSSGAPTFAGTIDGSISTGLNTRYDWNVSVSWLNTMKETSPGINNTSPQGAPLPAPPAGTLPLTIVAAKYGDGILCYNGTLPSNGENELQYVVSSQPYTYFFVNLNASRGAIGSILWWKTLNPPSGNYSVIQEGVDWNTGVFLQSYKEAVEWVGYSLTNGQYLWASAPQQALDYYGSPSSGELEGQIAYGNLYSVGYGGVLYCYNDLTGKLLWTYGNGGEGNSTDAYLNYPYGYYPMQIQAVGNGVIYMVTTAHTWPSPIYKGAFASAINATNGQQIWTLSSITAEFGSISYAMADGYNTWFNGYDNSIYVVGRGPSDTTVQAPLTAITAGNNVVIQGTVMDISSGTKQTEQAADFPNGVPCASDASMTAWMRYVYQQQPCPTNFTGVTVTLTAIDPNNNFITLGKATTDANGLYHFTWTPPSVPGTYLVTATFAGTNGYWGSDAQTAMVVQSPAPTAAPTASPPTGLATMSALTYGIVAVIIVIIVAIAIVALLLLRKKP